MAGKATAEAPAGPRTRSNRSKGIVLAGLGAAEQCGQGIAKGGNHAAVGMGTPVTEVGCAAGVSDVSVSMRAGDIKMVSNIHPPTPTPTPKSEKAYIPRPVIGSNCIFAPVNEHCTAPIP